MTPDEPRTTLARLLRRSRAYVGLAAALDGFPPELAGRRADGHRHTAWQLLEHLRLAAEDLVSYCVDPSYRDLGWPEGYWPPGPAPQEPGAWAVSVARLLAATERMAVLVEDPARDLYARVPTAKTDEHHTFRAALILLDHNSHHAGQLIALRRGLAVWPGPPPSEGQG